MAKPTIESVMTPYPYAIEIDAQAATARMMMDQFKIHHLPVRDGSKLVGAVKLETLQLLERCGVDLSSGGGARVAGFYSRNVHVVEPDVTLESVLRHMATQHVEVTLVVRGNHLMGIFTLTDACHRFAEFLSAGPRG